MATALRLSALLALLKIATAQTTTLNLPFMGWDDQPIVASVVSANNAATTLQLACPEGTDGSDCGLFPYQTLTYGPSTYKMDMSEPGGGFTMTQDCSIGEKSAICKESASGSEANFPASSTETYGGSGWTGLASLASFPVTVTKGVEKLSATGSATGGGSSAGSATSTGSGSKETGASVTGIVSASGSPSALKTGSAAPSSFTGAGPADAVALRSGFVGVAVGLLGGLLL